MDCATSDPSPRVVIAGGSGFVGRHLADELVRCGYEVVVLTRSPAGAPATVRHVQWDGQTIGSWSSELEGAVAVVNLTGKNVNCRYTRRNLAEIDGSRENAVRVIGQAFMRCKAPPDVLVQASTTAIYGNVDERWCDETTPVGEGVAVRTATKWEATFHSTETPTLTRRVMLRMSFVLGPGGGVLRMLSGLTKFFLGGAAGSGRQYISWIHVADLNRIFVRAIEDERMCGLYNASSPNPVSNDVFMRKLRRAHRRPWSPRTPAWAVRIGCFLLRTEPILALTGRRALPRRLMDEGFDFKFPDVAAALDDVISCSHAQTAARHSAVRPRGPRPARSADDLDAVGGGDQG